MKKLATGMLTGLIGFAAVFGQGGVPALAEETATLNIAYQYGLAYAALAVMQDQALIEQEYEALTGNQVEVVWNQMNSGADINTGISSGNLDVGFMGCAPAITGVTKGVGYKIFTNLSGQRQGIMTNSEEVTDLGSLIGTDKQIAVVNIGSIQHIMLAKALADHGYDAHALDANLVAMKHPDGMSSLVTGSVACHVTSSPYIFKELDNEDLRELPEVNESYGMDYSFIVGVAAETLYEENQDLYLALCAAVQDATDLINEEPETVAKLTCELDGNEEEVELDYLKKGNYATETSRLFELAQFMYENDFLDKQVENYTDLVFDNVKGN